MLTTKTQRTQRQEEKDNHRDTLLVAFVPLW